MDWKRDVCKLSLLTTAHVTELRFKHERTEEFLVKYIHFFFWLLVTNLFRITDTDIKYTTYVCKIFIHATYTAQIENGVLKR